MNEWDATRYAAKDNLLRVAPARSRGAVRDGRSNDSWTAATACPQWQVRDIVGHLIDVTESYFIGVRRGRSRAGRSPTPLGLKVMQRAPRRGRQGAPRADARPRRSSGCAPTSTKMMEICAALGPDEWGGLHGHAQVHGAAAGLLLPGVPAHGLRRARLGHPPGHRPGARAGRATPRTCSCRSCSSCGRPPRRSRRTCERVRRRHPRVRAATPSTTW